MSDGVPCSGCGSKRTTEIRPSSDGPVSIWCHVCGTVTTKAEVDSQPADDEAVRVHGADELMALWRRS
jgi:hypothetical protein